MGNGHGTTGFRMQSLAPLTAVLLAAIAVGACGTDEELSEGQVAESEARPLVGTYVGTVPDATYIALNSDGTQVGGYLSDGRHVSIWLGTSDIDDGRAELVARQDSARLGEVILGPQNASGTVEIAGRQHSFSAAPATGEAGLYRKVEGAPGAPGFEETGWIVLNDGSELGATNLADGSGTTRTAPAPERTTESKLTDPTTEV